MKPLLSSPVRHVGMASIHASSDMAKGLLVLAVFMSFSCSGVEARLPQGKVNPGDKYTVCATNFLPYQTCVVGDTTPTNFSGYGTELFHQLAAKNGWKFPDDYTLQCLEFNAVMPDLVDPNGICDVASSALLVRNEDIQTGVKYGYSDYHTGQGVMVYATKKKTNQWLFLEPFRWEVWVFLFVAAIAVGIFVRLVENIMRAVEAKSGEEGPVEDIGFAHMVWTAGAQVVAAADPMPASSFPARIIIFIWAFVILLVVAMYTGNAAAILTASNIDVSIQSIEDLRGKPWGAYVGTVATMHKNGWNPTKLFDGGLVGETQMVKELKDGTLDGLVWDFGYIDYLVASDCDLVKVGDFLTEESRALAWWQNASDTTIRDFNIAVLELEQSTDLKHLHDTFIKPPPVNCRAQVASQVQQVMFGQVSGLWIVLGGSIAFAVLFALVVRQWKFRGQRVIKRHTSRKGPSIDVGVTDNIGDNMSAKHIEEV